jgi:hypothetical protein
VFTRAQARAAGLSPDAIRRRLTCGDLVVVGRHTLTFGGVVLDWRGELQAGLLDVGPHALVSARSAAALLELDGYDEGHHDYLTLRTDRHRRVQVPFTATSSIKRADQCVIDGLPTTSATRCIVELLGKVTLEQLGNALDSACRMGLTNERVVSQRLEELGRQGRKGVADLDRLMRDVGVQSWLERAFLRGIAGSGLPRPAVQQIHRRDGAHIARVDFDFAPLPVIVEVGGRRGYLSYAERQRQEHRRKELQLLGKTVYFFTYDDVVNRLRHVIDTVRAAIGLFTSPSRFSEQMGA